MSPNFRLETEASAESRLDTLRAEAVEQNRRAKLGRGYERKLAYRKKANALSLLVLLGHAEVDSIEFKGGQPVVGLTVTGNVRLHALPNELSQAAREIVFRQVITCLNGCTDAR